MILLILMWKSTHWHFNAVSISFGPSRNVELPKTEYFPVVILNK